MAFDPVSFLAGIQVGRRLKTWDAERRPPDPAPEEGRENTEQEENNDE